MKEKKIGFIGGGFVGSCMARYFKQHGHDVKVYDKFKKSDPIEDVVRQDIIFIAVPTPYAERIDLSAMDEAMANAARAKEGTVVVIKSTVVPGTTDRYQQQYPKLKLIFNPEFLTEATADQDFGYPDRQIVGTTRQSFDVAADILQLLPLAPFDRIVPATAAEMVKYYGNNWFAVKVVFANQMFDVCEKLGLDYDTVMECVAPDKRIGRSHLEVWHKGYRGYGGKCLPKDIRAMIKFAEDQGLDLKLLRAAEEINKELTGGHDR